MFVIQQEAEESEDEEKGDEEKMQALPKKAGNPLLSKKYRNLFSLLLLTVLVQTNNKPFSLAMFHQDLIFLSHPPPPTHPRIKSLTASLQAFTKQKNSRRKKGKQDARGRGHHIEKSSSVAMGSKHRVGRTTKKQRRKRTGGKGRSQDWQGPQLDKMNYWSLWCRTSGLCCNKVSATAGGAFYLW